jgi:hypothetical protein
MPPEELFRTVPGPLPSAATSSEQSTTPAQDSLGRIEAEHRALRDLLAQIEAIRDLPRLLPLLERLETQLRSHFATEEAPDGLHSAVADSAPEKSHHLDELFDEHNELLELCEGLIEDARTCLTGPVARVLDGAKDLAQRLHDHEAKETHLFVDVVSTDLGGSD